MSEGRIPVAIATLFAVGVLIATAVVIAGGQGGSPALPNAQSISGPAQVSRAFASEATSICNNAHAALEGDSQSSPTSVSEGLEIEHTALAAFTRATSELQKLQPTPNIAGRFRAGLADDQTLVGLFRSILQRPDFVQLSITLPGHPNLVPPWLKAWLARSKALQASANANFAQIGIPACEKLLR